MPPTLIFLGDLDERNGVDLLLRAVPSIIRERPGTRLLVVGDGPLAGPLAAYARYLQLEEAVTFLPGVCRPQPLTADLAERVHSADLVAVPGREATWCSSYAIRAAWWAHKPVVATHEAAAGAAEHDADALLVYPSESAVAAAVVRLLGDPGLARKLGGAGHRRWLAGFPAGRDAPESRS